MQATRLELVAMSRSSLGGVLLVLSLGGALVGCRAPAPTEPGAAPAAAPEGSAAPAALEVPEVIGVLEGSASPAPPASTSSSSAGRPRIPQVEIPTPTLQTLRAYRDQAAAPNDGRCFPEWAGTCQNDASCGPNEVCRAQWPGYGEAVCGCVPADGCTDDSMCGANEVCLQGTSSPERHCSGAWGSILCRGECRPAGCREDSDCGENHLCVVGWDVCGRVTGTVCLDRDAPGCVVGDVCGPDGLCVPGPDGWTCQPRSACPTPDIAPAAP